MGTGVFPLAIAHCYGIVNALDDLNVRVEKGPEFLTPFNREKKCSEFLTLFNGTVKGFRISDPLPWGRKGFRIS